MEMFNSYVSLPDGILIIFHQAMFHHRRVSSRKDSFKLYIYTYIYIYIYISMRPGDVYLYYIFKG